MFSKAWNQDLLCDGHLLHDGVSPHGVLHAGRGGPREACNYLSMATARWGRPLGNQVGTTWGKDAFKDNMCFFFIYCRILESWGHHACLVPGPLYSQSTSLSSLSSNVLLQHGSVLHWAINIQYSDTALDGQLFYQLWLLWLESHSRMKHIGKLDQVAKRCILLPRALVRVCLQIKLFSKVFFSGIACLCLCLCQTSCWEGGQDHGALYWWSCFVCLPPNNYWHALNNTSAWCEIISLLAYFTFFNRNVTFCWELNYKKCFHNCFYLFNCNPELPGYSYICNISNIVVKVSCKWKVFWFSADICINLHDLQGAKNENWRLWQPWCKHLKHNRK